MTKPQDEALAFCRLNRIHHGREKRIPEVTAVRCSYNIIHVCSPDAVSGCRAGIFSRFVRKKEIYVAMVMREAAAAADDDDVELRTLWVKMSFAPGREIITVASSSARRTGISSQRQSRSDSRS